MSTMLAATNYPIAFAKTQDALLAELADRTETVICFGESLKNKTLDQLNSRPSADAWSALECLAHLNDYADMYLAQIEAKVPTAVQRNSNRYSPGLLGGYLAKAMHPDRREKKMKSPKHTNHLGSTFEMDVLDTFIHNLERYQTVISQLAGKSLKGSRIPFSLTSLIQFHLGDILTTLVWHNTRHCLQAEEVLTSQRSTTSAGVGEL